MAIFNIAILVYQRVLFFFSPLKLYLIIEFVPEDHELSDECWLPVKMEEPGVSKEDISRFSGIWRPFFSVC